MLKKLINKKNINVLGLNSGTSANGLDMAVVKVSRTGKKAAYKFLTGVEKKLNPDLADEILSVADNRSVSLERVLELDLKLGQFIAKAAKTYISNLKKKNINIDLIASHGQTLRHLPNHFKTNNSVHSATYQSGSNHIIATLSGKTVVGNFRQNDIALGGEGAPITTNAMKALFKENLPVVILNIGGMANYFYLTKEKSEAKDCGPGNVLIDLLMKKNYNQMFDKNGTIARSGNISKRLLTLLLSNRFFKNRNISTGREEFGNSIIEQISSFKNELNLSDSDIITTISELTVHSISENIYRLTKKDKRIKKLYLTGGGRKNIFIKDRLQESLPNLKLELIDDLGIDGDLIEASAYAVMGEAALRSLPMSNKHKNRMAILGDIIQPPLVLKK